MDFKIDYTKATEIKLHNMICKVQYILFINIIKSPIIIKFLYLILEGLHCCVLNVYEIFDIRLGYDWFQRNNYCYLQIDNYSQEWSYIQHLKGNGKVNNSWFKSCKCRICSLTRLLYKAILHRSSLRSHWCIVNILIRLDLELPIMQLFHVLLLFLKHNIDVIRLICLHQKNTLKHLISVMKMDSILRRIKRQMVKACSWIPMNISAAYCDYGIQRSTLIASGTTGLLMSINRFDFLKNQPFAMFAKWWVKQKIIQKILDENGGLKHIRNTDSTDNKMVKLKKLSLDYCFDDSDLHETIVDDDIEIDETEAVEPDEKLDITDVYDSMTTAKLTLMSPFEERSVRLKQLSYNKLSLSDIGSDVGLTKERIRQLLLSANVKFKEINCPDIMAYARTKPIDLPCEDLDEY
ncbi:RNA polymerase sigma factor rpoD [Candidatus Hodgkinia cicadicola]|uniref:RNA polymerase sigma factor rpoD n=1 Tax=Candidatus Hodgkinia cicadicola TaxID=573658 RepID=A0ABX4MJ59_9HYPH|nr:RNA polymerase sigma factor rpoD [Candidatus Hodgkinia cicadicola]PIM95641.1 RNA polymerase sigma factor rpoD [Candidatus Hodgkinia cicadicola]